MRNKEAIKHHLLCEKLERMNCVAKFVLLLLSNASRSLNPDRLNNLVVIVLNIEHMLYQHSAFEIHFKPFFIAAERATYAFCCLFIRSRIIII